jgi:hypothetical protein
VCWIFYYYYLFGVNKEKLIAKGKST